MSGLLTTDPVRAAAALAAGNLVGMPTETVYGLAADAADPAAVARIYLVKGRPADHPLIVHILDMADLDRWAREVPDHARELAERFWPGPLTLILPRSGLAGDHVTGGQDTVGLRMPAHPMARELLRHFGRPVAAPSANRFGRVSPTRAEHVLAELGDRLVPGRDLILDGGPSRVGLESTIVDCTGPRPRVLRPGSLPIDGATAPPGESADGGAAIRAPGTLAAHYAPRARVVVCSAQEVPSSGSGIGLVAMATVAEASPLVLLLAAESVADYARGLYAALRRADDLDLRDVYVVPPGPADAAAPQDAALREAILDRIARARTGSGRPD